MEVFKPIKPLRYPKADGTTMSQIELFDILTNADLDLRPIAEVVEPIIRGAEAKLAESSYIPEIIVL
jgi:hypothetical protein